MENNKFVTAVLAELNKTEDVKQRESVEDFVETALIECNGQIAQLETVEIPSAERAVVKAETKVKKAEKNLTKVRFSLAHDFTNYVQNRENALDSLEYAQQELQEAKEVVVSKQKQLASFKDILADLS